MNVVNLIESQLSDEVISKLASLVGASENSTRSAVGAAVPSLLSALGNMVSAPGGAQKLLSALEKFDAGSLGNLTNMLGDNPGSVLGRGSDLVTSLLGGNLLSTITGAISRFTSMGSGTVQKLLGYLMPLVMGGLAKRFAGKTLSPQGLASMLADEKANISDALPEGFSLDSVPGAAAVGSAMRGAAGQAQQAASSFNRWLLPVAGLCLLALVLWAVSRQTSAPNPPAASIPEANARTAVMDAGQIQTSLTDSFKSVTSSLAGITDVSSAAAALPKLKDVSDKLDSMKAAMDKLPEAAKAKIRELIQSNLGPINDQIAKLVWIPGVGDKLKSAADQVLDKYASLGGVQAPQAGKVSGELAELVSSMTGALTGIKDPASAEAALPKLHQINDKLDASKEMVSGLPATAKSTITSLLKTALANLRPLVDKVIAITGVGDKVKPVVDAIMGKLNALTA
jgi:hypothetical protein